MFNLSILRETRPIQNNSAIYRHDSKWKNEKNPSGKLFVFKANCSRPVGSAMPTTLKNLDGLKRGALVVKVTRDSKPIPQQNIQSIQETHSLSNL